MLCYIIVTYILLLIKKFSNTSVLVRTYLRIKTQLKQVVRLIVASEGF